MTNQRALSPSIKSSLSSFEPIQDRVEFGMTVVVSDSEEHDKIAWTVQDGLLVPRTISWNNLRLATVIRYLKDEYTKPAEPGPMRQQALLERDRDHTSPPPVGVQAVDRALIEAMVDIYKKFIIPHLEQQFPQLIQELRIKGHASGSKLMGVDIGQGCNPYSMQFLAALSRGLDIPQKGLDLWATDISPGFIDMMLSLRDMIPDGLELELTGPYFQDFYRIYHSPRSYLYVMRDADLRQPERRLTDNSNLWRNILPPKELWPGRVVESGLNELPSDTFHIANAFFVLGTTGQDFQDSVNRFVRLVKPGGALTGALPIHATDRPANGSVLSVDNLTQQDVEDAFKNAGADVKVEILNAPAYRGNLKTVIFYGTRKAE